MHLLVLAEHITGGSENKESISENVPLLND